MEFNICAGTVIEQNRHFTRANGYENHYRTIEETHEPYRWSVLTARRG